uniref:Uncharacterized protein n=1 Tax=Ditylenchus dipsaci TaxID=166011 RepID=A0A915E7Q3_9BILA
MFGEYEKKKVEVFEKLELSYSKQQLKEMNDTGYTMLSPTQLQLLYGPQSVYNNSEALRRLSAMNHTIFEEGLEKDIHRTSELDSFKIRQKDVTLSPIFFVFITLNRLISQPIILSPIVFSPITLSK